MKILCLFLALLLAGPKQPANMGKSIVGDSRTMYVFGVLMDGYVVQFEGKLYTVIQIMPYASTSNQDRNYIFCDDRVDSFKGKTNFVVISYDSRMHENGCNDLFSVNTVVPPNLDLKVPAP